MCAACSTCVVGTYTQTRCSASADTVCKPCAPCPAGTYTATQCTDTSDAICNKCTDKCPAGKYRNAFCTATKDTECLPCSTCPANRVVAINCTATSDTVCSGYTCDPATLVTDARPAWRYNSSACANTRAATTCPITCVGLPSVEPGIAACATSTVGGPYDLVFNVDYPDCPATSYGWGIDVSNKKCSGTPLRVIPSFAWTNCSELATATCSRRFSWDLKTQTCYLFSPSECLETISAPGHFTFKFTGPNPFFPVTIKSWKRTRDEEGGIKYTFTTQSKNCVDDSATGFTWWNRISLGTPDNVGASLATQTVQSSNSFVLTAQNVTTLPMWVKVQPMTSNLAADTYYPGPVSSACTITDSESGSC